MFRKLKTVPKMSFAVLSLSSRRIGLDEPFVIGWLPETGRDESGSHDLAYMHSAVSKVVSTRVGRSIGRQGRPTVSVEDVEGVNDHCSGERWPRDVTDSRK